jgi:hypothetical protein
MSEIKNLYSCPCLRGSSLTAPLKSYNNFFDQKVKDAGVLKSSALKVTKYVLGLVPLLVCGFLALIGMAINYSDVGSHNAKEFEKISTRGEYFTQSSQEIEETGKDHNILRMYAFDDKTSEGRAINQAKELIASLTEQYLPCHAQKFTPLMEMPGHIAVQY